VNTSSAVMLQTCNVYGQGHLIASCMYLYTCTFQMNWGYFQKRRLLISQIERWKDECISLSGLLVARVQSPVMAEYFKGFFSRVITLCQPVLIQHGIKWLNLPSIAPIGMWTLRRKVKVQPWIDDRLRNENIWNESLSVIMFSWICKNEQEKHL